MVFYGPRQIVFDLSVLFCFGCTKLTRHWLSNNIAAWHQPAPTSIRRMNWHHHISCLALRKLGLKIYALFKQTMCCRRPQAWTKQLSKWPLSRLYLRLVGVQLIILTHQIGQKLDHRALRRKQAVTLLKKSQHGGIHFLGNINSGSFARRIRSLLTKLAYQFSCNIFRHKARHITTETRHLFYKTWCDKMLLFCRH